MKITIHGLTVEGKDEKELLAALALVPQVAEVASKYAPAIPQRLAGNVIASVPGAVPHGNKGEAVAEYLRLTGGERFRRSREELAAGLSEEQAAQARIDAMQGGSGERGTAEAGASMESAEFNAALAAEMEG